MKRRELIQSLTLMGIGATVLKYQTPTNMHDRKLPMIFAGLGNTPCNMIDYFKECGLAIPMPNLYIQNYEKIKHLGWMISDLISDFEVLATSMNRYLLIVSPSERKMKDLASGMVYILHEYNIEYHVIIIGPFPFEGKYRFEQTNKFIDECYGASSIKNVEMKNVIKQYGQMIFSDAYISLYDDLMTYVKQNIL